MALAGRIAEFRELAERCSKGAHPSDDDAAAAMAKERRRLFGVFAAIWNDAEEAADADALLELKELRRLLRVPPAPLPPLAWLGMVLRLLLAAAVLLWGSLCVLTLAPARLLHPQLRRLGVPNGWLPLDVASALLFRAVMAAAGVTLRVQGTGQHPWAGVRCGIIVYNHASNLDPFLVNWACRWAAPKFVGKTSLFKVPFFGWLSLLMGMVPINRGDRDKAMHTMNQTVARIMRRWGRCVAIAPEGTRTTDGHLILPFKKGIFYLQEQTGAPLLPVVIHGACELWPPSQLFTRTGELTVVYLPPQPAQEGESSREASRLRLQRAIAEHMGEHADWGARPLSREAEVENVLILLCAACVFALFYRFYSALLGMVGLTAGGVAGLLCAASLLVAWLVDTCM